MCWFVAWQQTPCGTLPDDDRLIAARLGMEITDLASHRPILLRNWERHSDGRLYHPVMTELVLEKIARRDREAQRKSAYRERMKSQYVPHLSHGTDGGQTRDSGGSDDTGTGTGTGESKPLRAPSARESAKDGFTTFWNAYPKKIGKGAAEKLWKKLKPDLSIVLEAIERAKVTDQWRKDGGQFIPNPATWLNQKRWLDEPDTATASAGVPDAKLKPGDTRIRFGAPEVFTAGMGWVPA